MISYDYCQYSSMLHKIISVIIEVEQWKSPPSLYILFFSTMVWRAYKSNIPTKIQTCISFNERIEMSYVCIRKDIKESFPCPR